MQAVSAMDRNQNFFKNQLGPEVAVISENIFEENAQHNEIKVDAMEFQ